MNNQDNNQLTILSCGMGRDSMTILDKICDGSYQIQGRLMVVFSDTGNEHPHTYNTLAVAKDQCEKNGIDFHHLTPDQGFHSDSWQSLTAQWERNCSITSKAFGKSCTDNLKIKPIYRWLNTICADLLGVPSDEVKDRGKPHIVEYSKLHGKIQMIIGIAKGEEKRTGNDFPQKWAQESVERIYPLLDWGMNGGDCIAHLDASGRFGKVYPSNCMFCHYASKQEVLWLHRNYPGKMQEWIGHEARKIQRYEGREKNYGVNGAKLLPVILVEAQEEHGHMSDEELDHYKRNHGCSIPNAY